LIKKIFLFDHAAGSLVHKKKTEFDIAVADRDDPVGKRVCSSWLGKRHNITKKDISLFIHHKQQY